MKVDTLDGNLINFLINGGSYDIVQIITKIITSVFHKTTFSIKDNHDYAIIRKNFFNMNVKGAKSSEKRKKQICKYTQLQDS